MRKPFIRSFAIVLISAALLVIFSFGYIYSRFNDVGMLEYLTSYGGFVLCIVLIFFFIRLCLLSKHFKFWEKAALRLTSFIISFFVILVFFTAIDRTIGGSLIVPTPDNNGQEYSFTITDRDTSQFNMDSTSPVDSNLLRQKIIVPAEMVGDYEENTQYVVSYFYIDLGSLGFYYKVNQVN
ncbi:hypothetical protein VXN63_11445 [Marinilactibacillus sp. XAAS-LB27]|uniref:hypothetical protein n=1 Tax=Marinilactibacillus sp. XAAS-LB27 TaxID=3114538 RepID=UPI002E181005|nr:hypothetical protein [Marinilactibacillus sp. XAAS-LB27]